MTNKDYNNIPANACTFAAEIQMGDNGENAKTAPVRMLARSSQPIEHWFWGNVVHDTAGFNLNGKKRLSIDADHDASQAIGYANRFDVESEGLYMSGSLISHFSQDRADKIMRDMKAGIPYEASINFGGDGIKLEEVPDGQTAQVNGYEFAGPGVIIREWPLRNVAICLLGADGNTSTQVFSDSGTVAATVLTPKTETAEMSDTQESNAGEVDETTVELAQAETVEAVEAETATELTQVVETEVAEVAESATVEAVEDEAEPAAELQFSQAELVRMITDFGAEVTTQVVTNGGTYADAQQLHAQALADEVEQLRAQVAELSNAPAKQSGASPIAFADGEKRKPKMSFVQAVAAKARGEL